jgi:hypothetical protein
LEAAAKAAARSFYKYISIQWAVSSGKCGVKRFACNPGHNSGKPDQQFHGYKITKTLSRACKPQRPQPYNNPCHQACPPQRLQHCSKTSLISQPFHKPRKGRLLPLLKQRQLRLHKIKMQRAAIKIKAPIDNCHNRQYSPANNFYNNKIKYNI